MKMIQYLFFVFVVLAVTGMGNAAIIGTYVDADDSNTDASTDPLDPWMGTSTDPVVLDTDNLWTYRDDAVADFMENGGVWTGQNPGSEDPVELKSTLTGLNPGEYYNVRVVYAGHNAAPNWNIGAGFASGALTQFTLNDGISVPTGTANGDIVQLQALVGGATANASGEIDVFVDRMDAGDRSWYDGLAYETIRGIVGNYTDASESNTVASAGGDWVGTSTDPAVLDTDNLWTYRNDSVADFMENGGVWTGQAPTEEDPVELKTTLTGLVAGTSYDVGVVFAGHDAAPNWNIGAGFASGSLRQFVVDDGASKRTGKANGPVVQLQARVGLATADENGEIEVFVDRMDAGGRAWYDGLSCTPVQGVTGTYVDADDSNTDASAGGEWIGITGNTDTDNLWAYRSDFTDVMEGGGVWTGQFAGDEDPVELKTTITGLVAGASYDIGAVFAGRSDEGTASATWWNLAAGFESGELSEFTYFSDDTALTGKTAQDGVVVQIQAKIGTAVANANGEIAVYIDRADFSGRSWYDGLTYEMLSSPLVPGDANNDGKVDGSDVTILAGNWQAGVDGTIVADWAMGDFNGDGKVDGSDVTILAGNWQYGVTAAAAAVPEPGTLALLLCGIMILAATRLRGRK